MDIVVGIDPGLSGALAFYCDGQCRTEDMPVLLVTRGGKSKRDIDPHALTSLLRLNPVVHAFIEQVGAMPGQGSSSLFAFGKGYGIVIGVLAAVGIPYSFVSPRTWKSALIVPAAKDGARARASQLIPSAAGQWKLVKNDGRAEAALIALWGSRQVVASGRMKRGAG